jgi:lysophospholipase L1-like esterase
MARFHSRPGSAGERPAQPVNGRRLNRPRWALSAALCAVAIVLLVRAAANGGASPAPARRHAQPHHAQSASPARGPHHAQSASPALAPHHAQLSYLALGDSYAFGYSQARFNELSPRENPAGFENGYVNDFGDALRRFEPGLRIVNDACPGETTESFIHGPCSYATGGYRLHHPYAAGPNSAQFADALAYLRGHRGAVNPITIDLGGNDVLALAARCLAVITCIAADAPAAFAKVGSNLRLILSALRAAAPHAQMILLGDFDPFGETIPGGVPLTAKLEEVMARAAAATGARFADPLPVFNPPGALEAPTLCRLTNMCTPLKDIHPSAQGYKVLGNLLLKQYVPGLRLGGPQRRPAPR